MVRSVLKAWLLLGLTAGSADVAFRWPDVMATALADVVLGCLAIAGSAAAFRALRKHHPSPRGDEILAYRPVERHRPR